MTRIRDVHFAMHVEDGVILLIDRGTGVSITNAAEIVIAELDLLLGDDLELKRVIYRDTMGGWDGLAHERGKFIRFVPLNTRDRTEAIARANDPTTWRD
jgi:hypothetical protein